MHIGTRRQLCHNYIRLKFTRQLHIHAVEKGSWKQYRMHVVCLT